MNKLLDFFAYTHTPFLHARGKQGTAALLVELETTPGQRILEIGFGTGQTLLDIAARWPTVELYGAEKSALMLDTARRRLRFCGIKNVNLQLYTTLLPFPDGFFDTVFCESVLAIVPDETLPGLFKEINRVLKPGGRLCCNESLWLPETNAETIRAINQQCLNAFGIVQASATYPYPADWQGLGSLGGFHLEKIQSLEIIRISTIQRVRLRSALFSRIGWIKGRLIPKLNRANRQWRKNERLFEGYGRFLEGHLFVFKKTDWINA